MRHALLMTARWTLVARCAVPTQRRDWPQVIVWGKRTFCKATTGHVEERYVERAAYHPRDADITRHNKRNSHGRPQIRASRN